VKALSVRRRLLLWFAGLNGLVIAALAWILYCQRADGLIARVDAELDAHAKGVLGLCESDHGELCLEAASSDADEPRRLLMRDCAVATVTERRLVAGEPALLAVFAAVSPPAPRPGTWFVARADAALAGGRPLRALATFTRVPARPATEDEPAAPEFDVLVAVGAETAPVVRELASLRGTLVLAGGGVFLLSLCLGFWFAHRIAQPIVRLAAAARATDAGARAAMPRTGSGDELDDLAASLDGAFARLQAAFYRQTRFAANASHELRTPTAIVRTAAEVALLGEGDPERLRAALRDIHAASVRMASVIEALLVLARAGAAAPPESMEDCDLAALARRERAALRKAATAKGLTVAVDAPAAAIVRGDENLLTLLLANLLRNSIDHSDRPGTVRASVHAGPETVELRVSDQGVGIPAEALPHVFELFFRVDASRSRASGGAGLGLSLVKAIADLHGARCSIASEPGEGTTVSVVFAKARAG
jgi:signal transduction histidine kinase